MFSILEDPNPPVATAATLTRVRTRARRIRRRRNAIAGAPAAIAIGATGLFLTRLGDDEPEQVAAVSTSIPFTAVPTLPPFDDRGEVLSLSSVPSGYVFARETFVQSPDDASFERSVEYEPVGVDPDVGRGIVVFRIEARASAILRTQQVEAQQVTTPGGRDVLIFTQATTTTVMWAPTANVLVQVNLPNDTALNPAELMDSVEYEEADPPCVVDEAVETYPVCGPVEGREMVTVPDN